MKASYTDHLANQEYNLASELWIHAEDRLKECVERGDESGALLALADLRFAVEQRFGPILSPQEFSSTFLGIVGGILHFACKDAGLPPACLTLMLLWQKELLAAPFYSNTSGNPASLLQDAVKNCVVNACSMVRKFSLPDYSPMVRRCVSKIQQHLTEELTVDSLAASLGVSRQYLSAQFRRETKKTPIEYINYERITLAKYYLRQSHFTITQIALMCGFGDSNYFGRVFKNITRKTPSQYRHG